MLRAYRLARRYEPATRTANTVATSHWKGNSGIPSPPLVDEVVLTSLVLVDETLADVVEVEEVVVKLEVALDGADVVVEEDEVVDEVVEDVV